MIMSEQDLNKHQINQNEKPIKKKIRKKYFVFRNENGKIQKIIRFSKEKLRQHSSYPYIL